MIRHIYISLFALILLGCGDSKEEKQTASSPRIKKFSKVSSPKQNESVVRGTQIPVSLSASEAFPIDSVEVTAGDSKYMFTTPDFELAISSRKVGSMRLLMKVYSKGRSETHYRKVVILPEEAPKEMTYTIVNEYPHDTEDYTQGLLIKDGFLYESTGQRGKSTFKKKELKTGKTIETVNLATDLFGEGLSFINDEFYQLTWTSGVGLVYNMDMEQVRTFSYEVQGWGLTTLEDELVLTDETEKLYFMEPSSFTVQREIEAYTNEGKVDSLNELEVINGLIYANVYQEDFVVVIDPETGEILQKIDFTGLLSNIDTRDVDVLNGIAQDPETGKIYVTGKWWPKLFEITIQPKNL